MIDVRTAAKYLIQRYEQESGSTMDELKLHKLLYPIIYFGTQDLFS